MNPKTRNHDRSAGTEGEQTGLEADLDRIEFHRHGLALLPHPSDRRPGVAILVVEPGSGHRHESCSCSIFKRRICNHLIQLRNLQNILIENGGGKTPAESFKRSIWFRLSEVLSEGSQETPDTVCVRILNAGGKRVVRVWNRKGEELVRHFGEESARQRFVERCARIRKRNVVPRRGDILNRLALMTLTDSEKVLHDRGFQSRRQAMEGCFWYRVAYHGYRELGMEGFTFHPAIEERSGAFTVGVRYAQDEDLFRMAIPRSRVSRLLEVFRTFLPNQHHLAIHPIPLKSIFQVSATTQLDLEVRPLIQLIQENGESRFFERENLKTFTYGNLIYIKEMGILAELEPEGQEPREFRSPVRMVLKKIPGPHLLRCLFR